MKRAVSAVLMGIWVLGATMAFPGVVCTMENKCGVESGCCQSPETSHLNTDCFYKLEKTDAALREFHKYDDCAVGQSFCGLPVSFQATMHAVNVMGVKTARSTALYLKNHQFLI